MTPRIRNPRYREMAERLTHEPGVWVLLSQHENIGMRKMHDNGDIAALRKELGFQVTLRINPSGDDYSAWGMWDPSMVESEQEIERLARVRRERREANRPKREETHD